MTKRQIIAAAEKLIGRLQWHSFRAVPNARVFGTYDIGGKRFDGADLIAFFSHYTLDITFFYKGNKSQSDFELEKQFENAVREHGEFSCDTGYDSTNDLFYIQYHFDIDEEMED